VIVTIQSPDRRVVYTLAFAGKVDIAVKTGAKNGKTTVPDWNTACKIIFRTLDDLWEDGDKLTVRVHVRDLLQELILEQQRLGILVLRGFGGDPETYDRGHSATWFEAKRRITTVLDHTHSTEVG